MGREKGSALIWSLCLPLESGLGSFLPARAAMSWPLSQGEGETE